MADQYTQDLNERVVAINRVTKVVKGGRHFSFSALVVAGDGKGQVGIGTGKAGEVPESINKASRSAKKSLSFYNLSEGRTIPHQVTGSFGAAKVILKPAAPGTGLIAGGPVRAVLECVGVKDILSKRVGSRNPHNVVKAALDGLSQLLARSHQDTASPSSDYFPKIESLYLPLLRLINEKQRVPLEPLTESLSETFNLSQKQRREMTKGKNEAKLHERVQQALSRLNKLGFIAQESKEYAILEAGQKFLNDSPPDQKKALEDMIKNLQEENKRG